MNGEESSMKKIEQEGMLFPKWWLFIIIKNLLLLKTYF